MSRTAPHEWEKVSENISRCKNCPCLREEKFSQALGIREKLYKLGNYTYVHAPACKGAKKKGEVKNPVNVYEQLKLI